MTGTLLTTGNTEPTKRRPWPRAPCSGGSSRGSGSVTTVKDDVAFSRWGNELVDESVNGGTGLDEMIILRGRLSLATNSSMDLAPTTLVPERLQTKKDGSRDESAEWLESEASN